MPALLPVFVAEFIGSPAMNMIASEPSAAGLVAAGFELALTDAQRAAIRTAGNPAVDYGLRPEDLSLAETGVAEALIPGRFTIIEPKGPETYATVQNPVGALPVRVPGARRASVGEAVCLRWLPEQAHLFEAQSGLRLG